MSDSSRTPMKSAATYYSVITATALLAVVLVFWAATDRIEQFSSNQRDLMRSAADSVTASIQTYIDDRIRLIKALARDHRTTLTSIRITGDEKQIADFTDQLRSYFPSFFAFTLADPDGHIIPDDIEGSVGDICRRDIAGFFNQVENHAPDTPVPAYQPFIHPQPHNYHFDVMATWVDGNDAKGVFFVSFLADSLARILKAYELLGHRLYLLNQRDKNLIEVTSAGARDVIGRDIRLSPEEMNALVVTTPIPGTQWVTAVMPAAGTFDTYTNEVRKRAGGIIAAILLFWASALFLIQRLERKRALAVTQLAEAKNRAEEANRFKSEFLSIVNHELRTPVTSIVGAMSMILGGVTGDLPQKAKELVEIAKRNGDRLTLLINDLLDMEKVRSGGMSYEMEVLTVGDMLRQAYEANQGYAVMAKVDLRCEGPATELIVSGDRLRLQQVLSNLISNAAKFSPEGETVEVVAGPENGMIRISVQDRGPGIPEEFRDRIFQPFEQADGTDRRKKGGTGLGLAISKAIAEDHGGAIGFFDRPGGGTVFYLDLPPPQT